jgi:hypothetical protein
MPRTVLAGIAVSVVLGPAAFAGSAIAAPLHLVVIEETFPDEVCGIPGTATIRFTDIVEVTEDTFFATGTFRYQFTATDTGKSFTLRAAGPTPGGSDPTRLRQRTGRGMLALAVDMTPQHGAV